MDTVKPQPDDKTPEIHLDPEVEELWSSRALLLVLVLLILSFWVSYYLKIRRIKTVHETLVALFAGMVIGLIVRLSPGEVVQNMISFKSTIMMNVLLPPIILASGYDLKEANFFRNFGVILTFAFCGTFISAVVIGALVYIWALLGLEGLSLGIIECLLFGSTLSATDPVTVLAIFNTLKVDPKLYSIIFGESLLNDAVAIVMFETLSHFHGEKVSILSFFHGVGIFLLVFLTSMALGVIFGLSCSLMLKHSRLSNFPEIESCLVLLIAYTSYFFSNASTMSGIVSLLFCGITLKHYAYHNMSRRTQRTTRYMFTTLSSLCENFIFIYLGLSLFTVTQLVYKPIFILVSALAVCVARYCAVFPISKLVNVFFRKARGDRGDELPHSYQMMIFWAGLRGAVGVALAAGIKGESAIALRTTVLVTVVLTMVIFGGTTSRMIEIVGIRTGVEEEIDSSDEEGLAISESGATTAGLLSLHHEDARRAYFSDLPHSHSKRSLGDTLGLATANKRARDIDGFRSRDSYEQFRRKSSGNLSSSHHGLASPSSIHSMVSQETDDEVLPAATSQGDHPGALEEGDVGGTNEEAGNRKVWRDGQWFTVLDEHYLLPVFSNATASRKQASRKAMRNQRNGTGFENSSGQPVPDGDLAYSPRSTRQNSPLNSEDGASGSGSQSNHGGGRGGPAYHHHDHSRALRKKSSSSTPPVYHGSFSDALSALVNYPLKSPSIGFGMNSNSMDSLIKNQPVGNLHKKRYSDCQVVQQQQQKQKQQGDRSQVLGMAGGEFFGRSSIQEEGRSLDFGKFKNSSGLSKNGVSSAPILGSRNRFIDQQESTSLGASTGTASSINHSVSLMNTSLSASGGRDWINGLPGSDRLGKELLSVDRSPSPSSGLYQGSHVRHRSADKTMIGGLNESTVDERENNLCSKKGQSKDLEN
ncbi:Sodium/hydrogen exchanger family-domain-containing protein [Phakopsora pachyrhizi]|uniref:Sodium/hydrogen exchanger n=1 Tax=Phakopsora pachyrhizi TaxID=170000 RepID=A0AAV0BFA1_PHAPC|nr:Sodium/hydrogen exchanger family-domain-containing protein [Phakopsora pachyrhizi]CAH7685561.1 Sodium/hydrogen exchanger family-domain-containing protein [Phakopsora pachyrhizi]CAH7685794.1 Sodium/hydrogen exchanger family-domain-containing protein [Phakopsora pachyrhizi]